MTDRRKAMTAEEIRAFEHHYLKEMAARFHGQRLAERARMAETARAGAALVRAALAGNGERKDG